MILLDKGRLRARRAETQADLTALRALRARSFRIPEGDADRFDALCDHVMIEDDTGLLVGGFRMMALRGAEIGQCYSAQVYDLAALAEFDGPMIELGRFCLHPDHPDPDILRLAWGVLTARVDALGARLLFGCSSFPGTDPAPHLAAFAWLRARHLAPARWRPGLRAPEVLRFADLPGEGPRTMPAGVPPLLRTYLSMGGWVGDHAVIDRAMKTMHVFTGVEIDAIPPARQRLLRALAQG